eukprot:gb/GECG01000686.1/.p1 GENE.gb/GECG01000686.1/~~gb/GECG01000686.1/.p1  ORF type:complete len:129 (+),score=2.43 gb/GECG01000686.1/:1-387(+)
MMITRRIAQAISPIARHYAPIASVASRGMATSAKAVTYTEHGDPNRVLSVESIELNDNVSGEDVLIKMLSAPITPTDLAHVSLAILELPGLPIPGVAPGFFVLFESAPRGCLGIFGRQGHSHGGIQDL